MAASDLFFDKVWRLSVLARYRRRCRRAAWWIPFRLMSLETVRWWERHVVELLTGVPRTPLWGCLRNGSTTRRRTLRQVVVDKVAELAAEGRVVR